GLIRHRWRCEKCGGDAKPDGKQGAFHGVSWVGLQSVNAILGRWVDGTSFCEQFTEVGYVFFRFRLAAVGS
ncbi:MAG: hypothetical protein RL032_905, partial [Pseudomonadota bacterium]